MAVAGALALAGGAAHATTVTEGTGLLPTYTGDQNVPDLDVVEASAVHTAHGVTLSATMAGDIGTTADGIYVWGIDRGKGTELLVDGHGLTDTDSPIGQGIPFDAFIRISNTGVADLFRVKPNPADGIENVFFNIGGVTISGKTISIDVSYDLLPSLGLNKYDYGFNIWPRNGDISTNDHVTDFLPDHQNFRASGTPEPASWAIMITGFGLAGASLRRRRAITA